MCFSAHLGAVLLGSRMIGFYICTNQNGSSLNSFLSLLMAQPLPFSSIRVLCQEATSAGHSSGCQVPSQPGQCFPRDQAAESGEALSIPPAQMDTDHQSKGLKKSLVSTFHRISKILPALAVLLS